MRWIGAMAPLGRRETRGQRDDRFDGLARSEYGIVHRYASYDLTIDTATEPETGRDRRP